MSQKTFTKYTLSEVQTHDKENDAWIALHGSVYDITEWISVHPGGYIIMNGVGTDATELFDSIGHPEYVVNLVKHFTQKKADKYGILAKKIGELKI